MHFSSSILFDLIKIRKAKRADHSSLLSGHKSNLDIQIQLLIAKLVRLVQTGTKSGLGISKDQIRRKFGPLVSHRKPFVMANDRDFQIWKNIDPLHFQILFNCLTIGQTSNDKRSWILKPKFYILGSYLAAQESKIELLYQI